MYILISFILPLKAQRPGPPLIPWHGSYGPHASYAYDRHTHSATQIAIPTSSHDQSATQKETSSSQLVHETVQVTHAQSSKGQGSKGNILLMTF